MAVYPNAINSTYSIPMDLVHRRTAGGENAALCLWAVQQR